MASLHLPCVSISVTLPRAALPELCNACLLLSETTWCRSHRETFSMDVASGTAGLARDTAMGSAGTLQVN